METGQCCARDCPGVSGVDLSGYITFDLRPSRSFLRTPTQIRPFVTEFNPPNPKGWIPDNLLLLTNPASRARLGPFKQSHHGGLLLLQRRSRFPGNIHLLAGFSITVPPQASRSWTVCRGLIILLISLINNTPILSLRSRRISPRLRHSHNLSNPLDKSRIFGHNRTCPLPIPT